MDSYSVHCLPRPDIAGLGDPAAAELIAGGLFGWREPQIAHGLGGLFKPPQIANLR